MSKRLAEYLNRKFKKQARYFNRKDFEYADWKCKKCGYTVNEFRELIRGRMNTCPECGGALEEVKTASTNTINPIEEEALKYGNPEEFVKNINGKVFEMPINSVHPSIGRATIGNGKSHSTGKPLEISPTTYVSTGESSWIVDDGNHRYFEAKDRGENTISVTINPSTLDVSNIANEENAQHWLEPIVMFWKRTHNKYGKQ